VQRYNPNSALVVVDVQNDFTDPKGSLYVMGGAGIVTTINGQIDEALNAGGFVVYTQDWHPPHTPHFEQDGGIWPVHCVAGSWGAEFHPKLKVEGPSVRKGANGEDGYSGFTMRDPESGETIPTELEALLRKREINRVVVCGLATDFCVNATAIDAATKGFETAALTDAIRAVNLKTGDSERAIAEMTKAGVQSWQTRMR
jgi:nicotinamidase/pyrazinamidase